MPRVAAEPDRDVDRRLRAARRTCIARTRTTAYVSTSDCPARMPTRTAPSPTTASSTPTTPRTSSTCGGRPASCAPVVWPCRRRCSSTPTSSTAPSPPCSSPLRRTRPPGDGVPAGWADLLPDGRELGRPSARHLRRRRRVRAAVLGQGHQRCAVPARARRRRAGDAAAVLGRAHVRGGPARTPTSSARRSTPSSRWPWPGGRGGRSEDGLTVDRTAYPGISLGRGTPLS